MIALNRAPGFIKNPERLMKYSQVEKRVKVMFKGEIIADSVKTVSLWESDYPVVYYFPPCDVNMEFLVQTDHSSYCPFKGYASYWNLQIKGDLSQQAIWSYQSPYDEALEIKHYMAFYESRVDSIDVG